MGILLSKKCYLILLNLTFKPTLNSQTENTVVYLKTFIALESKILTYWNTVQYIYYIYIPIIPIMLLL